jgi:hypothetical protein
MKKNEELVVITKTYDLVLWSCQHTSRFPRQHRFVLGERLERNLYALLEKKRRFSSLKMSPAPSVLPFHSCNDIRPRVPRA